MRQSASLLTGTALQEQVWMRGLYVGQIVWGLHGVPCRNRYVGGWVKVVVVVGGEHHDEGSAQGTSRATRTCVCALLFTAMQSSTLNKCGSSLFCRCTMHLHLSSILSLEKSTLASSHQNTAAAAATMPHTSSLRPQLDCIPPRVAPAAPASARRATAASPAPPPAACALWAASQRVVPWRTAAPAPLVSQVGLVHVHRKSAWQSRSRAPLARSRRRMQNLQTSASACRATEVSDLVDVQVVFMSVYDCIKQFGDLIHSQSHFLVIKKLGFRIACCSIHHAGKHYVNVYIHPFRYTTHMRMACPNSPTL